MKIERKGRCVSVGQWKVEVAATNASYWNMECFMEGVLLCCVAVLHALR